MPPLQWRVRRTTEAFPGKENCVRGVSVKTAHGSLQRLYRNYANYHLIKSNFQKFSKVSLYVLFCYHILHLNLFMLSLYLLKYVISRWTAC